MSTGSRGIFLCPTCGNVAKGQGDGTAVCQDCHFRFALPEEVRDTSTLPEKEEKAIPPAGTGLVQRNIKPHNAKAEPIYGAQVDAKSPVEPEKIRSVEEVANPHRPHRHKKKKPKKKKRNYFLIFAIWLATASVVTLVSIWVISMTEEKAKKLDSVVDKLAGEERAFYLKEYPAIESQLQGFLRAESDEGREEFVRDIPGIGRRIQRFYRENSAPYSGARLFGKPVFWNVAFEESPGFVEVAWPLDRQRNLEAVFVKEEDEWRLDWEQYVRYDTENWELFRQNLTDDNSGIFRVYLEKVAEGQVAENPWIKIRFLQPHKDASRRERSDSPIIKLDGTSSVATQVAQCFLDRLGESDGYSQLWELDPRNFRRVTVALAWEMSPDTGQEVLVVEEILAQHWRSLSSSE
jgi:hypothetical protein